MPMVAKRKQRRRRRLNPRKSFGQKIRQTSQSTNRSRNSIWFNNCNEERITPNSYMQEHHELLDIDTQAIEQSVKEERKNGGPHENKGFAAAQTDGSHNSCFNAQSQENVRNMSRSWKTCKAGIDDVNEFGICQEDAGEILPQYQRERYVGESGTPSERHKAVPGGIRLSFKNVKFRKTPPWMARAATQPKKSYMHFIRGDIILAFKSTNLHEITGYGVEESYEAKSNSIEKEEQDTSGGIENLSFDTADTNLMPNGTTPLIAKSKSSIKRTNKEVRSSNCNEKRIIQRKDQFDINIIAVEQSIKDERENGGPHTDRYDNAQSQEEGETDNGIEFSNSRWRWSGTLEKAALPARDTYEFQERHVREVTVIDGEDIRRDIILAFKSSNIHKIKGYGVESEGSTC